MIMRRLFYGVCVLQVCCVEFVLVRLGISCCLWCGVMHILCVSLDAFNVLLFYILGLLVLGWEIPCHPHCMLCMGLFSLALLC